MWTSSELISARRSMHPAQVFPKPTPNLPELYGVRPAYGAIHNWKFAEGEGFQTRPATKASAAVCILGEKAKIAVFGYSSAALGKFVKVNDTWLQVIGVLKDQISSGSGTAQSQDPNFIVFHSAEYVPLSVLRYRAVIRTNWMGWISG